MSKFLLACFSFVLVSFITVAQDRVVQGKVTSVEDGVPLPGVNVVVKGTTNGAVTDADGAYKLSVPSSGGTLVFSFIGMVTQEVEIGERTVVDISMTSDATQLSEVVVTGQGISRDKKALGYAVATVGSNQLEARPVNDISRVLQGKIPGVNVIPTGGISGTGASINIRGFSTLTGSSQPLWVVDGVPFNSSTNQTGGFTTGGAATATSRFLDLDPNIIESVNVLKGLAATVLYGDQGRNGVILVTTKSGNTKKKNAEISLQQSTSITEIASLPDFQDDYGNGFQQLYGAFFSNWGPHFDEIDSVGHPYQFLADASLRDAFPELYFERVPYEAAPDPGKFFRKGLNSNTSVNITGGTDKLGYNVGLAYTTEEGYTPGNDLKRLNISAGFNAAVTDKVTVKSSILYSNTDMVTPPLNGATGGGGAFGPPSIYANFLYTPRNVDYKNWPYETPLEHKAVFYRAGNDIPNPVWLSKYMRDTDVTDRFFISNSLIYDFSDNISLSYRVGLDTYTQRQNREYNKGVGPSYANVDRGIFQTQILSNTIWNHDLIVNISKQITPDINLNARIGANARNDVFKRDGAYSESQTVFGLMTPANFSTASTRSGLDGRTFYYNQEQQRYGVYADISVDFKNYVFLNLAGRNDWNSALEKENNSKFYPSASLAFQVTDAFSALKSNYLNSLKLRVGYGTSAGFPSPYSTRTVVGQNLRQFVDAGGTLFGAQTVSDFLGNPKLKPELITELEAGFEARLVKDRVSIDFTWFNRGTIDLITVAPIDPSSGYTSTALNVGELSNKGFEVGITGTPLKLANGLQWDITWNYTKVNPEVESLGTDLTEIVLSGFTDRGNYAIPGKPTYVIKGSGILEDGNGNRVVRTADGLYAPDPNFKILGNPNPKYTTSLINSVSWKGISLGFQFDYRQGGAVYASTVSALMGRGVPQDVSNFSHDLTFILPGVKQVGTNADGTPIYAENDIQVTASDYGFNTQFFGYNEVGMFDGSTIRLREVSLGYSLPKSILGKTPIKGVSIMLTGNNLWFEAFNTPPSINFDPEVSSQGVDNGFGFDYLTGPSVKRYGAVLRLTF
jgi:TonB-linked SusC/RagA family outer membrane protein